MSSRIKTAFFLGLTTISFAANATNYLGLDYKMRSMQGHRATNYDLRQVLKKSYSSAEIYAAHRFDNNVGINIGYEQSKNAKQSHTFMQNELFLGATQNAGDKSFTNVKLKALHLDVNGYFQINPKLDLIGQLGVGLMQINIKGNTTVGAITTNLVTTHTYRAIPRIGMGMQYFIVKNFGIRALLNWEATNMYRIYMTDQDGVRRSVRPYKQSWALSLGIVGRF